MEISKIDESIEIVNKACPLFVPIVEEGWANTEVAKLTAKIYLQELKEKYRFFSVRMYSLSYFKENNR